MHRPTCALLLLFACGGSDNAARSETPSQPATETDIEHHLEIAFGDNLREGTFGPAQFAALDALAASGDRRVAWILSDLMRLGPDPYIYFRLAQTAEALLPITLTEEDAWHTLTNYLITADVPAPPNYLTYKRRIFTVLLPQWEPIFAPGNIDWRHVTWGGVRIDDRPYGRTDEPCNCIPAADDPPVTSATDAAWLDDDAVVFGVAIGGEYRAYPRQIMEVREMVNDRLGGRAFAMPYCTLSAAAQVYFTDRVPEGVERPILRTSGLLIRSNKVMYDVRTMSVFDTFRGDAVTGVLAERQVVLPQAAVVTTTWGAWRRAHPETTVLDERLALGRDFDFRNGRDANGPIFPVGEVDPRLPVQEDVLGVFADDGTPVAFPVEAALAALRRGERVGEGSIQVVVDGGGLRALTDRGEDRQSHQAFWFAWVQHHPTTRIWRRVPL
ncbi:MAG: DUF3179 domain-containing (seleno)protein [Myxococcota bacterium]